MPLTIICRLLWLATTSRVATLAPVNVLTDRVFSASGAHEKALTPHKLATATNNAHRNFMALPSAPSLAIRS